MSNLGQNVIVDGTLDGVNPHLITTGKYCVVGSHAALLVHCPIRGAQPVTLGDYVWVGYGAAVLPGVTIGNCCVIGAGSVVTKSMPANSIIAGNPARVLRSMTLAERNTLMSELESGLGVGRDKERTDGA